ncbi:hypothetical protein GGF31_006312 [Allomyces arbusculus]|nr:hypothetical protein GGF31_006312 [Allomyces arbusculus]
MAEYGLFVIYLNLGEDAGRYPRPSLLPVCRMLFDNTDINNPAALLLTLLHSAVIAEKEGLKLTMFLDLLLVKAAVTPPVKAFYRMTEELATLVWHILRRYPSLAENHGGAARHLLSSPPLVRDMFIPVVTFCFGRPIWGLAKTRPDERMHRVVTKLLNGKDLEKGSLDATTPLALVSQRVPISVTNLATAADLVAKHMAICSFMSEDESFKWQ